MEHSQRIPLVEIDHPTKGKLMVRAGTEDEYLKDADSAGNGDGDGDEKPEPGPRASRNPRGRSSKS